MGATVTKPTVPKGSPGAAHWLAWCDGCSDGYRGPKPRAQAWADKHNAERHKPLVDGR